MASAFLTTDPRLEAMFSAHTVPADAAGERMLSVEWLDREADALAQLARGLFYPAVNVGPVHCAVEGFGNRLHAFERAVEALPLTPENMPLRAKAALAMFGGCPHRDCTGHGPSARLLGQIVRTLVEA